MGYALRTHCLVACLLSVCPRSTHPRPTPSPRHCRIKQLTKLLAEYAPSALREETMGDLNGRKLAIDASMQIYQFLVAVRSEAEGGAGGMPSTQLMNAAGEVTSHLQGMWYRTIKFVENGIKPVYVFDGKPPTLKSGELAKRTAAKAKAHADLAAAKEAGSVEDMERFAKRTVRMDKSHTEDCKTLLRLMGMPVVEAPCEAEAQCAALAKADKVYAAASEDMDTLTFGAPRLVRWLWWWGGRPVWVCVVPRGDDDT